MREDIASGEKDGGVLDPSVGVQVKPCGQVSLVA